MDTTSFGPMMLVFVLVIPIILLDIVMKIVAIVSCAKRPDDQLTAPKAIWIIIIIMVGYLGWIFYFLFGRK